MSDAIVTAVITTAPAVLWVLFATIVFFVLRRPITELMKRMRSANVGFGSFDFDNALEAVAKTASGGGDAPSAAERRAVADRMEFSAQLLEGVRILWVDDHPENNSALIGVFDEAKMSVRIARSTAEGLAAATLERIDIIITDMSRSGDHRAGEELVEQLAAHEIDVPVIMYTFDFDPRKGVHPGIFGYTTAYDELIHLVIDAAERLRFAPRVRPKAAAW